MLKNSIFSNFLAHSVETPRLTLTVLNQNVRRSVPYILNHIWQHWKKIVAVRSTNTNETTPQFFEFLTPPPPSARGRWTPGGEGTSADIVPTQIKFGVDPSTRCWNIAQKPPKCKNSPLTPIVTKISFPPFSVRRGPLNPKMGEDTFETRIRSHAKLGLNRPAGCREIVDRTNKNTYSKTNTSPFALTSEWRVIIIRYPASIFR